jgi:hypothetical protein
MESIDPALYEARGRKRAGSFWDMLLAPRLRLAYAFALGLAVGVAIYSLVPGAGPPGGRGDLRGLYGTMAGGVRTELVRIDTATFSVPGVKGRIDLKRAGDVLVVEPDLEAAADAGLVIRYDPAEIRFEGYGAVETMDMKVIAREGSITTSGTLAGGYVLTLLDTEGAGAVLDIEVLVSGSPAYRHEFTVDGESEKTPD